MDTISTSKLTLWRVILMRYRTVPSDVFSEGSLGVILRLVVFLILSSEASKQAFCKFSRVLKLRSKLSRFVTSSEASKQAFSDFSLVLRLRKLLSSSFLEF